MGDFSDFEPRLNGLDDSREYIEKRVQYICAEVLQKDVEELDLKSSFTLHGGDSLLAIKVMGKCRKDHIEINVIDLLTSDTITEVCHRARPLMSSGLETPQRSANSPSTQVPHEFRPAELSDTNVTENLRHLLQFGLHSIQSIKPCSPTQERLLISQSVDPSMYQCCYTLKFSSTNPHVPLNSRKLAAAWKQVVKRHSTLRTVLISSSQREGHFDQIVLDSITPSIELYEGSKRLSSSDFALDKAVAHLSPEIPHRVQFVQITPKEVYVKFEVSHVVVDGQSAAIILRDLFEAYSGKDISTPALSYAEFSASPNRHQPEYFLDREPDRLSNEEGTFLPVDRGHESQSNLMTVNFDMSISNESQKKISSTPGVTPAIVCQLAWALVLHSLTASDRVCFSYATSGRNAPVDGLQDAVGPFVDSQLCRIMLRDDLKIKEALVSVAKDTHSMAIAHSSTEVSDSAGRSRSVRQLSNTTISFQRALDDLTAKRLGVDAKIMTKHTPTDVSQTPLRGFQTSC